LDIPLPSIKNATFIGIILPLPVKRKRFKGLKLTSLRALKASYFGQIIIGFKEEIIYGRAKF
jgi:hypothetical protein